MCEGGGKVIGEKAATWTSRFAGGGEHKVINDKLSAALEEGGERNGAYNRCKDVVFGDLSHGEITESFVESILGAELCLLLGEKFVAGFEPFSLVNDLSAAASVQIRMLQRMASTFPGIAMEG